MAAGSTDKVGKRLGGKTSEAYLRLRDGKRFVLACQHSRMGRQRDGKSKAGSEYPCRYGTDVQRIPHHTGEQGEAPEYPDGTGHKCGELDSLIAIPHKTHGDSIRIIKRYGQLESIVKSLNNNENNNHD